MMAIETFPIRDLRERTGDLTQYAEAGQLALVTKRGRPLFVTVPFTEELLREGVGFSLAVELYRNGMITAARGALLAGMDLAAFLEELSALEVPVADYSAEEVADELARIE